MKKTIFLFLVLITIVPFSHAQSDATLEETIEWLNKFGFSYFGETQWTSRSWQRAYFLYNAKKTRIK